VKTALTLLLTVIVVWGSALAQGIGDKAPDFTLASVQGEVVRLSDLTGEPIVLNFWATWCPPCRAELPLFQRISDEVNAREDASVRFVLVNLSEPPAVAHRFLAALGIDLLALYDAPRGVQASQEGVRFDATAEVMRRYRARGMPTTLFIDAEGVVRAIKVGELLPSEASALLASIGVRWRP
jgi:cytochrome c biogenesis protein CcmG/thiol:disulfide interchange protein DsbE